MKAKMKVEKEINVKYLGVNAHVRYWEDAEVNGVVEQEENPTIPFSDETNDVWNITIDVEEGRILDWQQGIKASTHYKVCDEGVYTLLDENKEEIAKVESYVPDCLAISDSGYGDYICLDIDETGKIDDWSFTEEDVEDIIKSDFHYEKD